MDREKIKKIVYFIFVGLVSPLIFEPASKILQSAGKGLINAGINYFFYCCGRTNAIEVVLNYAYLFLVCLLFVPILCALSALKVVSRVMRKFNMQTLAE